MAQNVVASVSAVINIDQDEMLRQSIDALNKAQSYANGHTITYKITGDKAELEKVVKQIEGLSPDIRTNILLDFDSSELNKQMEQLQKYITQDAKAIGNDFKKTLTASFKGMNLKDIISGQIGEGAEVSLDNLKAVFKTLRDQTKNFDISKVTSVDDIAKQATALKQLSLVTTELQKQGVKHHGRLRIDEAFGKNITDSLESIFAQSGEIIFKNASQWAEQISQTYEDTFSSLKTMITNLMSGKVGGGAGGSFTSSLDKEIEEVKKQLKEAQKLQDELGQRQPVSKKRLTESYDTMYDRNDGEKAFVKTFQQYIKNGNKVKDLNQDIVDAYNQLSERKDFLPIAELEAYAQRIMSIDDDVERLSQRLEELQQKQAAGVAGDTSTGGTGTGSGGVGSTSDEEVAKLKTQLQETQDKLKAFTEELTKSKADAEAYADMIEYANKQIAELQQRIDAFSQGQVSIVDFNNAQTEINNLTNSLDNATKFLAIEKTKNTELSKQVESQQKELDKAQQLQLQLQNNNQELVAANKLLKEQVDEADIARQKYEAIADKVEMINHFLANMKKYSVDGLQVATDALNKEYTTSDDERLKDKAAIYYGQYKKAGGTSPLLMNGDDVSEQILERYKALQKMYSEAAHGGELNAKQTWQQLQAIASATNQHVMALEKQNAELRETLQLLKQEERVESDIVDEVQAKATKRSKKKTSDGSKHQSAQKMSAEEFKKAMLKDRGGSDTTVQYTDQSSAITEESKAIDAVTASIQSLEQAVDRKTNAFREEEQVVAGTVQNEISNLEALDGQLFSILQTLEKIKQQMPLILDVQMPEGFESSQTQVNTLISDLKSSLSGLDANLLREFTTALNALNVKESVATNVQKLANAVLNLKSNLNNVSFSGNEFLKSIKELVAQGDSLKDLAVVLNATKEQIQRAQAEINTKNKPEVAITFGTREWKAIEKAAASYKDELGEIQRITYSMRQDKDGKELKSYRVVGSKSSVTLGENLHKVAESETHEYRKTAAELEKIQNDFIRAAQKSKIDFDTTSLKIDNQGVITFTTIVEKLGDTAEVTTYKIKNLSDALNKDKSLSKTALNESVQSKRTTKSKDKTEQDELNASIKEYQALMAENNKLDAKNAKTRESNANYLLTQELKLIEQIAQTKAQIIKKESKGEDVSVLNKKLALQGRYLDSLHEEMQYYEGTAAYNAKDEAVKNKTVEASLIMQAAKIEADAYKKKVKEKEDQDELNASIKEYQALMKENNALDAKNAKTRESNANYLLTQELKTLEQIAATKAKIVQRESQGKDSSALQEKLSLQKQYLQSLVEEMQYYNGTVAYQDQQIALQEKAKEVSLTVKDAENLANQKKALEETEKQQTQVKNLKDAYSQLEKVLRDLNALEIKSVTGTLTSDEQLKKNDLLAQKSILEATIDKARQNNVLLQELQTEAKHLQDLKVALDADKNLKVRQSEEQKVLNTYKALETTLEKINHLQINEATKGISADDQHKLTLALEEQARLEKIIANNKLTSLEITQAQLNLENKRKALSDDLATAGVVTSKAGNAQTDKYNKAVSIDSSLYMPHIANELEVAQTALKKYYQQLNDGSVRSKADVDELNASFNKQLEIINKLKVDSNLINEPKSKQQFAGYIASGLNVEQGKNEILGLIRALDMGQVSFDTFTRGHKAMVVSIRDSQNQIKKYHATVDEATGAVKLLYQSEKVYTSFGSKWLSGLKSKIVQLTQYISGIEIIMKAWQALQQGFETIRELDTALTEMRKVSDETVVSLRQFQKASFDVAKTVGATASTIQNSTADFMRIGESLSQAAESASVANILLNVSEFESIDEATESLIAMSQAYQDLDKIDIVDIMNNLGNNFAISTDGLATALQNSASALVTAKNDIYEAAALATAANTVVQDPDKVGAGIRTIALRITGTKSAREELQSLGEDVDDFVVTTSSKLNQQVMDLTKTTGEMGVSLLDANGNYRSTYEILQDIADIWEKIAEEDLVTGQNRQNALLELLAGKNRSNILASILQNPDILRDAFNAALGSEGSAQKELEKYLDSIEGKITQLTNNVQEFWATFIDTDVVKGAIDVLSDIVKIGTWLVDTFGSLPVVLGGAAAAFTIFNKNSRGRAKMFAPKTYKDASGEFNSDVYELCVV